MADEREFEEYVTSFRNEIITRTMGDAEEGSSIAEDAVTDVMLKHLEEEEGLEGPVVCRVADSRSKAGGKINGYALSSNREEATLFISAYHAGEVPEVIASSEVRKNFERLRRVFDMAVAGKYKDRDH